MRYDYSVVGGGPRGAYAAPRVGEKHDVILYEEHPLDRQPVHCAGIISISGLQRLDASPRDSLLHSVRAAKLVSPGGIEVTVESNHPKAYIVDRSRFDEERLSKASDAGATIKKDRARALTGNTITCSKTAAEAGTIVLATGVDYGLQRSLHLPRPRHHLVGAQCDLDVHIDPDFVELHFIIDDFFAWIIPTGDGTCRVGAATGGNPTPALDRFVRHLKRDGRITSTKKTNAVYGVIPVHDPNLATQHGAIRLVGDAAGHVKATTGGGIVMGCTAVRHLDRPDYDAAWRADIGGELKHHLRIHRLLAALSDKGKDTLFSWLKDNTHLIEEHGDMDYTAPMLSSFARHPRTLAGLLAHLPRILWDLAT